MSLRRKLNNIQIEEDSVEMAGGGGKTEEEKKTKSWRETAQKQEIYFYYGHWSTEKNDRASFINKKQN